MAEAIRRSERLQKKREAADRSRHESDKSESDQEEISFSKRAQPSGSKANKGHRRALVEDDEVLSVFGRLSMTSDQANDSQEKESASDSDGQSTTSSQSRAKTKAQRNYEEALRAYHDAKYEAPRVREELDRRLRLAAAALASERAAKSTRKATDVKKTTPVARPRAVNVNQTAEKSTEQDDTVDEFLTSMRERFRSMINDSQSPPRSANVALVNPPSSSKQAVAVVMNKVTASQASVPVNMPVSSAVLSMATSISSTAMITTSVVSLPVMTAVTTTTSSLPVTAVIGLTSTPIPARVQVEEELERRLAEAEEKIRAAEAAERRAMAAEKLVKEAEAKFLSIEIASEILSVSERQSNKSRIRSREAEQGSELTSAASEVRKAIRGNPNLTTVDNIALFSTSDNRKEAHVKKQSNGTVEKISAGIKSKQLPPVKRTEKKKSKARMTRVEEEEILEMSDDESKLESASRVGRSSRKIQPSRSRSPSSSKRRVRVQETSSESEKSVASAGRKERKNIKLPVYSGDSFLDQFLLQFRNCAELSRWPKEEWGKRLIPCLEGRGCAVLTKKLMSGNPSYGKIVRALRLRFGGEDDPSTWRSALKRRERREKESLTDLAFWISDYLDKAYTEGSDMDPVFAVDLFIDALTDPRQRLHVECGKPANLQEALHLAQIWESAHRSESARQYRHSKPVRARQITTGDTDAEQSCSDVRVVHEKEKKSGQKKKEKARKGNNKGRESQVKNEASQSRVQETAAQGDWMRAIEECKAEIRELKLQQPVVKNDFVPQGRGGYSGQPNRGVLNANAQPFHPVAPYRYAQPQMQRGCFICHAPDHFKRECPYYQAPPAQQQQVGNGQSRWTADQAHGQSQNRQ